MSFCLLSCLAGVRSLCVPLVSLEVSPACLPARLPTNLTLQINAWRIFFPGKRQ